MNKTSLTIFAMVLTLTTITTQAGQGGFQGPSARLVIRDVAGALNASDDTHVELTGRIVSSIGDDNYIFRDATGDIRVEIDDDLWHGNTITPNTQVIIRGEVDKDWSKVNIDVNNIQIVR